MKNIPLNICGRLINSGNLILVTAAFKDKLNIATIAWHMPLSKDPAMLGIGVAKKHCTSELIKKSEEFIINIPSMDILEQVLVCGRLSGHDVDKFEITRFTARIAEKLTKTPKIGECLGWLDCYLRDIKEVGDHYLFIGEVISAVTKDDVFDEVWNLEKAKLIYHLGGNNFFTPEKSIKV